MPCQKSDGRWWIKTRCQREKCHFSSSETSRNVKDMPPSDSHPDGSLVWGTSLDSTALREGISKAQEAWESDRLVFLGEYVETGRKPDTIGCSWWWCCGLTQAKKNLSDHVEIQVPKRGFQLQMKFSNFSQVAFWQSYLGQCIESANYTPAKFNDSSNCFHLLRMFGCIYLTCFFWIVDCNRVQCDSA